MTAPDAPPPQASILVVEDDRTTADLVALYLRRDGHRVTVEQSGDRALERLRAESFDLLILDVMLPGANGLEIARATRARGAVPIIFVTARTLEEQRIEGFALGADDYVTKPFSPRELAARVQAVLRRAPRAGARVLASGDLVVDLDQHVARVGDRSLDLTPSELGVLTALMERPGHVRSRGQLLDRLSGGVGDSLDRTVDVHISNLRRKLDASGGSSAQIETVIGAGYRLAPPRTGRPSA
jgi:DNA-binding response OmpR family regulator